MQASPCCKLQLHNEVVTRTVAIFCCCCCCCCSLWTRLAFLEPKRILLACLFAVYPLAVRLVLRIVAMLGSLCSCLPASHDLPDSAFPFPFRSVTKGRTSLALCVCVCVLKCTCLCIAAVVIIVNGHLPSACLLSPNKFSCGHNDSALNDDSLFLNGLN